MTKHFDFMDGMRGFAVLAVMFFHVRIPPPNGGNVGVDIFFALSGFLITKLLLKAQQNGMVSLKWFYFRRARRILPALLLFLLVIGILQNYLETPWVGSSYWRSVGFVLVCLAHFQPYLGDPPGLLQHLWSLSVEEQFYLFWPIALILIIRLSPSYRRLATGVVSCTVAILVGMSIGSERYGMRQPLLLEVLSHDRLAGILLGCFGALWLEGIDSETNRLFNFFNRYHRGLSVFALGVILLLMTDKNILNFAQLRFTLVSLLTTLLVIVLMGNPGNLIRKTFELSFLTWVGRISYGLYLWHYSINSFLTAAHLNWWLDIFLYLSLTFTAACLSYYGMERYFLKLKVRNF